MRIRGSNYRLKYYDFLFMGKKYTGCNLSMGQFSWGAVFCGAICPRGNSVDDKSSERQFSSGAISRGILSGGNYLWSNCLGAIILGKSSRGHLSRRQYYSGAIILRGICPGHNYPGGNFPCGQSFSGATDQGTIIQGAIFLRGNFPDIEFLTHIYKYIYREMKYLQKVTHLKLIFVTSK